MKWTLTLTELAPAPVFLLSILSSLSISVLLDDCPYLLVFCTLQEIILRSAVQHSLMHFLTGRFAMTRIIATATLIAAATYLHMKESCFPFAYYHSEHFLVPVS